MFLSRDGKRQAAAGAAQVALSLRKVGRRAIIRKSQLRHVYR